MVKREHFSKWGSPCLPPSCFRGYYIASNNLGFAGECIHSRELQLVLTTCEECIWMIQEFSNTCLSYLCFSFLNVNTCETQSTWDLPTCDLAANGCLSHKPFPVVNSRWSQTMQLVGLLPFPSIAIIFLYLQYNNSLSLIPDPHADASLMLSFLLLMCLY